MKNILVVDDDAAIGDLLSNFLSSEKTRIITSTGIEQAKDALSRDAYALVITDLSLKGRDGKEGLELLDHVKMTSPGTEVILMTGTGSEDIMKDAYERGALQYMEKPIDLPHLLSRINSLE